MCNQFGKSKIIIKYLFFVKKDYRINPKDNGGHDYEDQFI